MVPAAYGTYRIPVPTGTSTGPADRQTRTLPATACWHRRRHAATAAWRTRINTTTIYRLTTLCGGSSTC